MQFQSLKISEENQNKRLDSFLSDKLKISRNQIQRLIDDGNIRLNNKDPKKAGIKLKSGDEIHYRIPDAKDSKIEPEDINLNIIHEDENLIVINKAPGIVVHPDDSGHDSGTIVNAVLAHSKDLSGIGGEKRPGIVHRLDKDTSGVLIIAKNDKTHQELSKHFKDRKVEKKYLALVNGHPKTKTGKIDAAIQRDSSKRKQMAINPQGKKAISHFKLLEKYKDCSLLEVQIETGRTHQIRLHLASIGLAILGDDKYGDKTANKEFKKKYALNRQFLHAKSIKIASKSFEAPLWSDLELVLDKLSSSHT